MPPTTPPATTADFEYLLAKRNVLAVEYDPATTTVHAWVSQKLTADELDDTDNVSLQVPDAFDSRVHDAGMDEDKDYLEPLVAPKDSVDAAIDVADPDRTDRHRPIEAGLSENHYSGGAATGGLLARVTNANAPAADWDPAITAGDLVRLSNMHVYGNSNTAAFGDPIYQPSKLDGGTEADTAGRYCGGITLADGVDVDVAARTVTVPATDATGAYKMPNMARGVVRSGYHRLVGERVRKGGRTTAISDGTIQGVNATGNVKYNDELGVLRMPNQILATDISRGGDSGSPVYALDGQFDGQLVGHLYAGSETITLVNKAGVLEQRFGVRFMPERLTSLTESIEIEMEQPTLTLVESSPVATPGDATPVDLTVRVKSNYDLETWIRATGPVDSDSVETVPPEDAETGSGDYEFEVSLTVTAPEGYTPSFSVDLEGGHIVPDAALSDAAATENA